MGTRLTITTVEDLVWHLVLPGTEIKYVPSRLLLYIQFVLTVTSFVGARETYLRPSVGAASSQATLGLRAFSFAFHCTTLAITDVTLVFGGDTRTGPHRVYSLSFIAFQSGLSNPPLSALWKNYRVG